MVYIRGVAQDYDNWRQMGLDGWGYSDLLPYFKYSDKVQLTGNKRQENYYWHTGYPGGIKSRTKEQILEGDYPERVLTLAVKRMLPSNRLSRKIMTNLRVYAGTEHPHEAQAPEVLDVKSMNKKNTRVA